MTSVESPMDINRKIHLFKDRNLPTLLREYRFKTKEEFLKKYGEGWRTVGTYFNTGMDYLLGKNLEDYQSQITIFVPTRGAIVLHLRDPEAFRGYRIISSDMLIIRDEFRNYKTKEDEQVMNSTKTKPNKKTLMSAIKTVVFDDKNKTTTVVLLSGLKGVSKCSDKDVYDKKIGFALACMNALAGSKNQFQQVVDEYTGEAEKKRKEREYQRRLHSEMKLREYNEKQKIMMRKAEEKRKKEAEQFEKDLAEYTKQYKQKKMEQAKDKEGEK